MAYTFDNYDNSLVISGWEKGVADSPHQGISDMRNVNIISVPGEASVNFSTQGISSPQISTTITVTGLSSNAISFSAIRGLENGMAIQFTNVGSLTGVSLATTYWCYSAVGYPNTTSVKLYAQYSAPATASSPVTIGGTAGGATFIVPCISYGASSNQPPKYFTYGKGAYFMQDTMGQVWSNTYTTDTNNYWTYTGLSGSSDSGGFGLAYYQSTKSKNGFVFAFRLQSIDYFNCQSNTWVYGWKPSDGSPHNTGTLLYAGNHEAFLAPDNRLYYCDGQSIGSFYETIPTTDFDPTNTGTYTQAEQNLLSGTDIAQCLTYLGTNLLIGGQNNIIYPWDRSSPHFSYPIPLPEYNIHRMITVNTTTYVFVGNRGRIYQTNGTNAQLYKKVPDHISGTVEPYFTWGGACSTRNQLYFGCLCVSNAGVANNQYGGVWAIDLDTDAIRLTNQLSYGTYYGNASAIIPNFSTNPGGTGLFIGWDAGTLGGSIHCSITTGLTTITANSNNFSPSMTGAAIYGTGIPDGAFIASVTNSTTAILNIAATATNSNVILSILFLYGIDQTVSSPYTGSQATIDTDLIPIGTFTKPRNFEKMEYRLTVPMVSGESITLKSRLVFNVQSSGYSAGVTDSTVGNWSNIEDTDFSQAQWVQFQIVLNSTATNPSFTRLKEIRIRGLVGSTLATNEQLSL